MSISRRLFLRHTAVAGVGATITSPAVAEPAKPLTPDQRIDAALEEIVSAYREKWPDCPIRINVGDTTDYGMLVVITHCGKDKPGSVTFMRDGERMVGGRRNG
jgi:hypothetical protein